MLEQNKPLRTWAIILAFAACVYVLLTSNIPGMSNSLACCPPVALMFAGAVLIGVQEISDKLKGEK
jgi:fatty acid desaturase